jgi:ubiquinone/menaquinone biosynthesis C-methylase UbiE
MNDALRTLLYAAIGLPLLLLGLHTVVRIIRYFHKFPMPEFAANIIDNPFRRRIQPPDETPVRHGVNPGMTVLEVGPGNGTYTVATARRVGERGKVITVDIEPKMIDRVKRRAHVEGIGNIEARVADVYDLPFEDGYFDLVYMIAVIGEIPAPKRAMMEFHRVLAPQGTLVFSELFMDPDYPRPASLERIARSTGFRLKSRSGSFVYYTLIFEKSPGLQAA